jgi:hypothetical protein
MKAPEWTKYVRVDEMIECFPIGKDTQRALMEAMPNAYAVPEPGEDAWPEPDSEREAPFKVSTIWDKVTPDVQTDLDKAYREEREF